MKKSSIHALASSQEQIPTSKIRQEVQHLPKSCKKNTDFFLGSSRFEDLGVLKQDTLHENKDPQGILLGMNVGRKFCSPKTNKHSTFIFQFQQLVDRSPLRGSSMMDLVAVLSGLFFETSLLLQTGSEWNFYNFSHFMRESQASFPNQLLIWHGKYTK